MLTPPTPDLQGTQFQPSSDAPTTMSTVLQSQVVLFVPPYSTDNSVEMVSIEAAVSAITETQMTSIATPTTLTLCSSSSLEEDFQGPRQYIRNGCCCKSGASSRNTDKEPQLSASFHSGLANLDYTGDDIFTDVSLTQ